MGVVYKARLTTVYRGVALKMIQAGRLASEAEVKRFRLEAEAVARLDHPNIVPIYEVGEHDGRLYFSMRFIEGFNLAQRITRQASRFTNREIAQLTATVAHAVHYAHQRGVLHRDLKPANILIDAKGEPHITDFGLAKQIESVGDLTLSGAIIGTPQYMAPEQAAGKSKQVTTAADVYSLGAILYELLTDQPPFRADTPLETMRRVVEEEPKRPSSIHQRVDRELETICLKCLQKSPAQRYGSAEALAEDLERWLRQEPIRARRASTWERAGKWARRSPARAALVLVSVAAVAGFVLQLLLHEARLTQERNHALQQEQKAEAAATRAEAEAQHAGEARSETRQNLYAADMLLAQHALDEGNLGLARRLVLAWQPQQMTNDEFQMTNGTASPTRNSELKTRNLQDLRGFEWRYLWKKCQGGQAHTFYDHSNAVHSVAFSHDGKLLASGDDDGSVRLWDLATLKPSAALVASQAPIRRLCFSADDHSLATGDQGGLVKVWNLATREAVWSHQGRNTEGVQLSPVGTLIGVTRGTLTKPAANFSARVVDWTTGKEAFSFPGADFEAFSPDGKLAFTTGPDRTELWELETRRRIKTISNFCHWAFPSPDGRSLAELPSAWTTACRER